MRQTDLSSDAVAREAAAFEQLPQNQRAFRLIAIARANPDSQGLQFPPSGVAYREHVESYIRDLEDKYALVHALVPLAAAAALTGDDAWAARILGAWDAVLERTGTTVVVKAVHTLKQRTEQEVRSRLGPDRWACANAAGRSTSIDALLKDIDRVFA